MKPNALQKIVLKKFPNSKVVNVTDTTGNPTRDASMNVKKAVPLCELKAHLAGTPRSSADPGSTSAGAGKKTRTARASGPSGIVTIAPANADGTARRQAKTVVVSRGKVIALQG